MNQWEAVCNNCQTRNGRFQLHNLRDHGHRLTLCTLCVLKLHRESFCPICFRVYGSSSTAGTAAVTSSSLADVDRLICRQCRSMTHSCCAKFNVNDDATASAYYVCPICSDPKWFDPDRPLIRDRYLNLIDGTTLTSVLFDEVKANGVIAAAKIVEEKMRKIADLAKEEAERKAAVAVEARKRAKEALKAAVVRAKKEVGCRRS